MQKTDNATLVASPLRFSFLRQTDLQNAHRLAISDINCDGVADGECPTPHPVPLYSPLCAKGSKKVGSGKVTNQSNLSHRGYSAKHPR